MAFKRSEWNDLIDSVNEVLRNPPGETDCNPLPAIDHVGPNTIWRKSHIKQVQDALKATCDSITFNPIPDLWKQSIVDEINTAIGQAWCNCEPKDDDCTPETAHSENGMEIVLYDNGPPIVVSTCIGTDTPPIPLKDLVNGVTFGMNGIFSRIWRVFRRNIQNNGVITTSSALATGVLNCHGVASYTGTQQVSTAAGIGVGCFDCSSDGCAAALADAAGHLGDPNIFYNQYVLIIDSTFAACARPGDCP